MSPTLDLGAGQPFGRRLRAFTLIELLVVVAIIALLLSILLPSLSGAREQGKKAKCLANMRSTAQAANNFLNDHGRFQLVADEVGIASADPDRRKYAYGDGGELLSWPVALAQANGADYRNNWDWGVRAAEYNAARSKSGLMRGDLGMVTCPSDRVRIASPYYPRNKSISLDGINNNGLYGTGDPDDPTGSAPNMSYWGFLSYAINEDVTGAEVAESKHWPACWRAINAPGAADCTECKGEYLYPAGSPCSADRQFGVRLRGNLDKVYRPGDVGLIFEAGRDDEKQEIIGDANLVMSASCTGPYLGDFQQMRWTRIPPNRHPRGAQNVLFADMHGATVRPVKFRKPAWNAPIVPLEYAPQVRVSPYPPAECP